MNQHSDFSRVLERWFDEGPTAMPDRVVYVVADRIAGQPQRLDWRRRVQRRLRYRIGFGLAAVLGLLVVAAVAVGVIGGSPPFVPARVPPAIGPIASAPPGPSQPSPRPEASLAIEPGRIVVEVANTTKPNELRYVVPDGRALPLLPEFGGHQRTAAWRPDGERLAFAGRPDDHEDRWMDQYETLPDGTSLQLMSTDCQQPSCVEETDPAYSPDGTQLVAVRLADLRNDEPTRSVLVIYDLRSGRATEIPNSSYPYQTHDIGHPRWSPDGTQIVFHVVEGPPSRRRQLIFPEPTSPGPSRLHVIGSDGSGLRQLTPDGISAGDPDWSPDGSTIIFGSTPPHLWLYAQDQTGWQIQSIRSDGSDLRVIVPDGNAITPSWIPGGDRVLFMETNGRVQVLRSVAPDGSNVRAFATFLSAEIPMYPAQQPTP
jgi:Tol biopolymer transport system component